MVLTLKKDSQGKFAPATAAEISAASTLKDDVPRKHNEPNNDDSVLQTTLQEANRAKDVTLEELGL